MAKSRTRSGGAVTPRRCAHCGEHHMHNSATRYCFRCRPLMRRCLDCNERCVPVYAGRCQFCHDAPPVPRHDHEIIPPPSVDPGRPDRLKKYADRAAAGLPLFEEEP